MCGRCVPRWVQSCRCESIGSSEQLCCGAVADQPGLLCSTGNGNHAEANCTRRARRCRQRRETCASRVRGWRLQVASAVSAWPTGQGLCTPLWALLSAQGLRLDLATCSRVAGLFTESQWSAHDCHPRKVTAVRAGRSAQVAAREGPLEALKEAGGITGANQLILKGEKQGR